MLAEPMQERPDTDRTPLSIECANPLANDFFQRRLDAVRGLAFRFDSGRKELPSVVIGTENVFDGTFPKAQRRGNTPRRVLRRHNGTCTTFLIKDFLQAHDKLASPQINRFSLRHIRGNLPIKSFWPTQMTLSGYPIRKTSAKSCETGCSCAVVHVSTGPPAIPDGGLSPVR